MHTFNVELNQLKGFIDVRLRQPYLELNIGKPKIDMDKLFILNYIYKQTNMAQHKKQQYIITVMLIQIALELHESVVNNVPTNKGETKLQLSVLAGDFYSAHYYKLLADLEDIKMIRTLATVIKETSENKMKLYYQDNLSMAEYMHLLSEVEILVFQKISEEICEPEIMMIIREVLLINKLEAELELVRQGGISRLVQFIADKTNDNPHFMIRQEIEKTIINLDRKLHSLSYFHSEFKLFVADKFKLNYKTSIAEEG